MRPGSASRTSHNMPPSCLRRSLNTSVESLLPFVVSMRLLFYTSTIESSTSHGRISKNHYRCTSSFPAASSVTMYQALSTWRLFKKGPVDWTPFQNSSQSSISTKSTSLACAQDAVAGGSELVNQSMCPRYCRYLTICSRRYTSSRLMPTMTNLDPNAA